MQGKNPVHSENIKNKFKAVDFAGVPWHAFTMKLSSYLATAKIGPTEMARRAGMSHSIVIRLLSGERKPSWDTMRRIDAATEGKVRIADDFVPATGAANDSD